MARCGVLRHNRAPRNRGGRGEKVTLAAGAAGRWCCGRGAFGVGPSAVKALGLWASRRAFATLGLEQACLGASEATGQHRRHSWRNGV
jgi:hypothetical protein